MSRTLTLSLSLGVLAGALAAVLLHPREGEAPDTSDSRAGDRSDSVAVESELAARFGPDSAMDGVFSSHVARYLAVAQLDVPAALVSRLEAVTQRPASLGRNNELEALAAQLFEADPLSAAGFLQTSGLSDRLLSTIFRTWAQIDAQAAINLLDRIREPSRARLLALAVIEIAGDATIEQIVSETNAFNAETLRMAALVQRANDDPIGALQGVSELKGRDAQEFAILEIGRVAARGDPVAAAAAAGSIAEPTVKRPFITEVYRQWALSDVPRFLEHLRTQNPEQQEFLLEGALERPSDVVPMMGVSLARLSGVESPLVEALALSAESDPMLVLEFGQEVGGWLGMVAEAAALETLAAGDPAAATRFVSALPDGFRRDQLTTSIARGYARNDVDAAMFWAGGLSPPNDRAVDAVMTAIASTDLARAVRIELEDLDTRVGAVVNSSRIPSWFASRLIGDLDDPLGVIDQIIAAGEGGLWEEQMLTTTLSRWSVRDPAGAIAWMQSNSEYVPAEALETVTEELGGTGIERRLSLAEMLTPERRPEWILETISDAAYEDPNGAMAIAERYRAEPYYDSLVHRVVTSVASSRGPEEAARFLGPSPPSVAVRAVSRRWADANPAAATAWASSLQDQEARAAAVTEVATTWAERDTDAATAWARSLAETVLREQALAGICREYPEAAGCG